MVKLKGILFGSVLLLAPLAALAAQTELTAEQTEMATKTAITAAFLMFGFMFLLVIAFYVYYALCLLKLAKKTNTPDAWMAWVPIVNMYLTVKIAGKEGWWFLLFFIPFVNVVIGVIVWMEIAKKVGKPDWIGILIVVPIANIIMPGYLAFTESPVVQPKQPQDIPEPTEPSNPLQQ